MKNSLHNIYDKATRLLQHCSKTCLSSWQRGQEPKEGGWQASPARTHCVVVTESKRAVAGSRLTSTKPTCHYLLLARRKHSWRTALALEEPQLPPPSSERILTSRVGAVSAVRINLTQRSLRAVSHCAQRTTQHLCTLCSPLCTTHTVR